MYEDDYGPSVFGMDKEKESWATWGGKKGGDILWKGGKLAAWGGKKGAGMLWKGGKLATGILGSALRKGSEFGSQALSSSANAVYQGTGKAIDVGGTVMGMGYNIGLQAAQRIREDTARKYKESNLRVAKAITHGEWDDMDRDDLKTVLKQVDLVRKGTLAGTGLDPYYGTAASREKAKRFYTQAGAQEEVNAKVAGKRAMEERRRRERGEAKWLVEIGIQDDQLAEPYRDHYVIEYAFV